MKKITVTLSNRVFREIRSQMSLRCMTGESYGAIDALMVKLIKAIDNGDSEVGLKMKDEEDDILSGEVSDSS